MPVSPARVRRTLARVQIDFSRIVDPRDRRGRRHGLAGMLTAIVLGLASGKRTLRGIEDLTADLGARSRRRIGLGSRVSDTAMYELLRMLPPVGLDDALDSLVRSDIEAKRVLNDLFQGGVLSIDGKSTARGSGIKPHSLARQTVCDEVGTRVWYQPTLRAALTSSSAVPCLGQVLLGERGEASVFRELFEDVCSRHPRLFQYVIVDAGITSAHNAQVVRDRGKDYIFAIKGNFSRLYRLAQQALADAPVVKEFFEGKTCHRLRRVACPDDVNFPDASEFWSVTRVTDDGTEEVRIFVTSAAALSDDRALKLVRGHWRIENNLHWTADIIFEEDDTNPCYKAHGPAVISWLRLIAHNIIAVMRAKLPARERCGRTWQRAQERLYQELITADLVLALAAVPIR